MTTSNKGKADVLNEFFVSVFTEENTLNVPDFKERSNVELSHVEVTSEMLQKRLASLNVSKAAGPDQMHPRFLKELSEVLSVPLTLF